MSRIRICDCPRCHFADDGEERGGFDIKDDFTVFGDKEICSSCLEGSSCQYWQPYTFLEWFELPGSTVDYASVWNQRMNAVIRDGLNDRIFPKVPVRLQGTYVHPFIKKDRPPKPYLQGPKGLS